jgi:hypothetical protein
VGVRRWLGAERVVTGLDGRVWKVRRRWKLRLRWRQPDLPGFGALDPLDAAFAFESVESVAGFLAAIAIGIVAIAALAVLVTFLLPLVLLVVEAVVLAVWVVVLGRSWTVEAVTEGPPPEALRLDARGWRGSRRAVEAAVEALERGESPR